MADIGSLVSIGRSIVKGMRMQTLTGEVQLTMDGIEHDRTYAIFDVREGKKLNGRDQGAEQLLEYQPFFRGKRLYVALPTEMGELAIDDPELEEFVADHLKREVRIVKEKSYDQGDVSLVSSQTLAMLGEGWKQRSGESNLYPLRFRIGLELDLPGLEPKVENTLIGRILQIGPQAQIQLVQTRDKHGKMHDGIRRCQVITFDPANVEKNPDVLTYVGKEHGNIVGVYAKVLTPGTITLGSKVSLLDP